MSPTGDDDSNDEESDFDAEDIAHMLLEAELDSEDSDDGEEIDPNFVPNQHVNAQNAADAAMLAAEGDTTKAGPNTWTVIRLITPTADDAAAFARIDGKDEAFNRTVGLKGFDWTSDWDEFKVFKHLSPMHQDDNRLLMLTRMNAKVEKINAKALRTRRPGRRVNLIKPVVNSELYRFEAAMFAAPNFGELGKELWRTSVEGLHDAPDFEKRIGLKLYRWEQLKRLWPYGFRDASLKDTDDWWKVRWLVDGWNKVMREHFQPSCHLTEDESMIAFRPQTSATGDAPHLTSLPLKPEDLGFELKNIGCGVTGVIVYQELQEGQKRMWEKPYYEEYVPRPPPPPTRRVCVALCLCRAL